jgi:hypothetical protein
MLSSLQTSLQYRASRAGQSYFVKHFVKTTRIAFAE